MAETRHHKVIQEIEPLDNTLFGNRRYRVRFTDGTVIKTRPDAQVADLITNSEYNTEDGCTITVDRGGLITHVEPGNTI